MSLHDLQTLPGVTAQPDTATAQFVFNHTSVDHTKYDSLRRAIYLPVIRNNLYAFFEQFDLLRREPGGSLRATGC